RLDLDGKKLTTRGPATALPPSAVFRFSLVITGAIDVLLGCLAARRLLSPGVLGRDPASRVTSARGRIRSSLCWHSLGPTSSQGVLSCCSSKSRPAVDCVASAAP